MCQVIDIYPYIRTLLRRGNVASLWDGYSACADTGVMRMYVTTIEGGVSHIKIFRRPARNMLTLKPFEMVEFYRVVTGYPL